MASRVSTSSPRVTRKPTPTTKQPEVAVDDNKTPRGQSKNFATTVPLQTNSLANLQPSHSSGKPQEATQVDFDDMLDRLRLNDSRKPNVTVDNPWGQSQTHNSNLNKLVMNLDDHSRVLRQQEVDLKTESDLSSSRDIDRSSTSDLYTPASENFDDLTKGEMSEMELVKQELEAARSVISRQQQELEETRIFQHTLDQAMGPPSESDFSSYESTIDNMQSAFNASARPFTTKSNGWGTVGPQIENLNNAFSGVIARSRNSQFAPAPEVPTHATTYRQPSDTRVHIPDYAAIYGGHRSPVDQNFSAGRVFSNSAPAFAMSNNQMLNDDSMQTSLKAMRRTGGQLYPDNIFGSGSSLVEPQSSIGSFPSSALPPIGSMNVSNNVQQYVQARNSGLTSSPFDDLNLGSTPAYSTGYVATGQAQTYVTPLEPMNYRRLLDKSVSCDWKYIVDKIVCNNDQQASIFLQQKLKVGTAEQKFEIVESIIHQAYPLMINRFGNFLVQRCFEHGTPDQVVAIANAIHGNVISLSMDPFGCHVVQKAFDSVPETHKADMVRELLRRIPDTVIHRYACHVWQKLFELRWSGEPPQIMNKVNDALRGMWHEVALGETGSLVVQNIFENCVEEEKRPAIEEVISSVDLIAHGQFGNWCIQHLCEHGSPPDKRRVVDHILTNAYSYSIDQYASKVVEKCLKISGLEFLERYLDVITTAHPDRPRIPLIDIAGDQYGNYLIQWILMNTHQHQREQVAIHIRKHMVSLRGSKFGSRVAMLCCNPASITRPGPGALVNPYGAPGQPRNQWNRLR